MADTSQLHDGVELARAIRLRIMERTSGRIAGLAIEVGDDNVRVNGHAPSFHVKQLALRGIVDVIGSVGAMRIELNIQVDSQWSE